MSEPILARRSVAADRSSGAVKTWPRLTGMRFIVTQPLAACLWISSWPDSGAFPQAPTRWFEIRWVTNGNRKLV